MINYKTYRFFIFKQEIIDFKDHSGKYFGNREHIENKNCHFCNRFANSEEWLNGGHKIC